MYLCLKRVRKRERKRERKSNKFFTLNLFVCLFVCAREKKKMNSLNDLLVVSYFTVFVQSTGIHERRSTSPPSASLSSSSSSSFSSTLPSRSSTSSVSLSSSAVSYQAMLNPLEGLFQLHFIVCWVFLNNKRLPLSNLVAYLFIYLFHRANWLQSSCCSWCRHANFPLTLTSSNCIPTHELCSAAIYQR